MNYLKPIKKSGFKFDHVIGTGGIGSGIFFKILENNILGRNESRLAELLPVKDYCKLHIVFHYIAVLLGALEQRIKIYPICKVGNDETGKALYKEMQNVGIDMSFVAIISNLRTLFSVCYQYPDKSGGNITTKNSACSKICVKDIENFFKEFHISPQKELIISLPEVPLDTRLSLLRFGRERGSFNVASVTSSEIYEFDKKRGFEDVDLITLNYDEAKTIVKNFFNKTIFPESIKHEDTIEIINYCINFLVVKNPEMMIVITVGSLGSYAYWKGKTEFTPVLDLEVKSTAGAGDAFLAGTIIGICCGLPFIKGHSDSLFSQTPLNCSVELGSLLASLSVNAPNTINHKINNNYIKKVSAKKNIVFSKYFSGVFS